MKILVTDGMDASAVEQLRKDGHEIVLQSYEPEQLGTALRDFDAVIVRSATKIRQPQIDCAKNSRLKLIIRAGVGLDNIDTAYAEAAGIQVRNTPCASSNAVAELTLALLFACARNISIAGHTMRERKWEKKAYSKGFEVSGKTMGIIGYGRIGHLVGAKAQALGMNVLSVVHRHKLDKYVCDTMHVVTMDELFAQSDIIVLCTPSTDEPLIDADALEKMKDGVVIINVSRGKNLDETALLKALNSGKAGAAGLDVWSSEKNLNWELASHPSVACTPHIGAGTKEAQKRIGTEIVSIIREFTP